MKSNSLLPYGWMLLGAFAFSIMAALANALGEKFEWQVIATCRTGLALLFASLLALRAGVQLVFWWPRTLWMRSIAGSVSLVCTFFSLTQLPVADVLTLTNAFPIWIALLSWPLLRERPGGQTWLAIAVGALGVVLVEQPHLLAETQGSSAWSNETLAALLALLSSFSTSIAMLGLHQLHHLDPRAIVVHFSGVSLVVCLASFAILPTSKLQRADFDLVAILMLLGLGICATIGQVFLTKAFAAGPPAKVSVVALTQVAFAVAFDLLLLKHSLAPITLVGMALVIAPTAWLLVIQGEAAVDDL